jgi:hypothetical protein
MITMLYEKTLSRKVVSISSKPQGEAITSNGVGKHNERTRARKALDYILRPFRSKKGASKDAKTVEKAKELATMGKIMNLMR